MPEIPNTPFENKLASSDFGKMVELPAYIPGSTKPPAEMSIEELSSSLRGQANLFLNKASNPYTPQLISPLQIDQTGRYDKQLVGWDNEDVYGSMQSNWDKAANGVLKSLTLAGTTFLQGTVGLVNGLGNVIAGNGANSFYNNDFSQFLDKINKEAENYLPNYYTSKETNAKWYSTDNLFTANFLWDKLIKNAGFSLGAIYSGAVVSKGLSSLLRAVPLLSDAGQLNKVAKALDEVLPSVPEAGRLSKFQEVLSSSIPKMSAQSIDRTLTSLFGAATEGGIEALQGLNEFRDAKIAEFQQNNFRAPNEEELQKINEEATSLGNARFFMNIGLLSATNYIQLPKILGSRYSTSKAIANTEAAKLGETAAIRRNAEGVFERAVPRTKFGRAASATANAAGILFSPTEAFEEGAQYIIQEGTRDYYNKKYGGEGASFLSSLYEGASQLGSKEGMESIILGGLSGGIQQSGLVTLGRTGEIKRRGFTGTGGEIGKATESLVGSLNTTSSMKWFSDMQDAAARGINLMKEQEKYIRQGDILETKDKEADLMHNYLAVRIKNGRYDLVKDDIASLRQQSSTQDGLNKLIAEGIANEQDTTISFNARLSNFERHADNLKPTFETLSIKYGGLIGPDGTNLYSEDVIDQMAYAVSKIADYDERIPQLSQQLLSKGIELSPLLEGISKGETTSNAEAFKQIEDLQITIDQKDSLKEALSDILEMTDRRTHFLSEYERLVKNPEAFKEAEKEPVSAPPSIKVVTKDGEENIETGVEYYLGQTVSYDKNGNQIISFPKLTILGENEDGTIKIKANGQVRDVSKDVLASYKLGKVSDLQNNKKAKFYFDHINDIFEFNFGKGKKQKGRLQYSPKEGILLFSYRNKYGKTSSIEVTGDQFVPKKGYSQPMINKVGTLTAAEEQALKEFAEEKDSRQQAKRASRLQVIENLVDETGKRLSKVEELLQKRYSELENINTELSKLEQKIKAGELTKRSNFKATTNRAIKAANKLSRLQEDLRLEIQVLEGEKEELEFNLEYFTDLASNIDELPTDSKEFLEELKSQTSDLENLILETGISINKISSLIDKVEEGIEAAISLAQSAISDFKKKFPKAPLSADNQEFVDFLQANPNFLKLKPSYKEDLKQLEEFVSNIEDINIEQSEDSLKNLRTTLEIIQDQLQDLEKQYKAKSAILSKYEKIAEEFRIQKQAEQEALKDIELQKKFFNVTKKWEENDIPSISPEESITEEAAYTEKRETPRKPASILFNATTTPGTLTRPSDIRHQRFLSQIDLSPNRNTIRRTFVTSNNEGALGLKGLIAKHLEGYVPKEGEELILAVYVSVTPEGTFYINEKGELLSKIGELADQDQLVYAAMPSTSLEDSHGKRYSGEEETAKAWQEAWEEKRKQLLSYTDSYEQPEEFNISRGVPIKSANKEYILGNLVSEEQLRDQKEVLIVSTTGSIQHQGRSVNIPVGSVMIQNGATLEYANNRNLTDKEAEAVYNVIKEFARKAKEEKTLDAKLAFFLRGILFFSSPYIGEVKQEKPVARNQIYLHQGSLFLGEKEFPIPFLPTSIEANKPELMAFLKGAYNHINNSFLTNPILSKQPFIEYTGNLEEKEWPSYQTYLLSKEGRSPEEVPLSTLVRPIDSSIPNDRNYNNRYSYANTIKEEEIQKPVTEEIPAPTGETEWERTIAVLMANASTEKKEESGFKLTDFVGGEGEEEVKPTGNNVLLTELFGQTPAATDDFKKMQEDFLKEFPGMDMSDSQFRVSVPSYNYTRANVEAEAEYIKNNSPFSVETVQNLVSAQNGIALWGAYKNAIIYLDKAMEEGTGYHELFEGVFDVFLNKAEKQRIYKEFVSRKGAFIDRPTGVLTEYSLAIPQQAKEEMAEEFRNFKLYGEIPSEIETTTSPLLKFFQDLLKWIKSIFTGEINSLDTLFSRMDSAYYKNVAFKNAPTQYLQAREKIGEFDAVETDTVVKAVVSSVFQNLFQEGKTQLINDLDFGEKVPKEVYDRIKLQLQYYYLGRLNTDGSILPKTAYKELKDQGVSEEEINNILSPIAVSLFNNWGQVVQYAGELLKTFKILQESETDKEGEDSSYQGRGDESYLREAFEWDGKKNAPASIKLLIATLQESVFAATNGEIKVGEEGKIKKVVAIRDQSTRMQKMVDYAKTFNALLDQLSPLNTFDQKEEKLKQLSDTFPEYVRLITRLRTELPSIQDWHLRIKFYNTFSKQHPLALNTYLQPDGTSTIGAADVDSAIKQLSNNWLSALKSSEATSYREGKYFLNMEYKKGNKNLFPTDISTPMARFKYLEALGIKFSPEQLANMTKEELSTIQKSVSSLTTKLKGKSVDISSLFVLGVNGPLNDIYKVFLRTQNLVPDSVFAGLDGNYRQTFVQTNAISRIANDINNAKDRADLLKELPHLQQEYSTDSYYLNNTAFNAEGNKLGFKFLIKYIQGIVSPNGEKNIPTEKLSKARKLLQGINQNLNENYYVLIPADSKTEWMVGMKNPFLSLSEAALKQFFSYYQNEQSLPGKSKSRIFNFLKDSLTEEEFNKRITEFVAQQVEEQFTELKAHNIITNVPGSKYKWEGIDEAFIRSRQLNHNKLSPEDVNNILEYRTVNFMFNNIEMHKLFFGDPAFYSDFKRFKSFLSPREQALYGANKFNSAANHEYNYVAGEPLKKGDPGYQEYKEFLKTVTLEDIISTNDLPGYKAIKGTDAQAFTTPAAYRQMRVKTGRWNSKNEEQLEYINAEDRQLMAKDGVYKYSSKSLEKHDVALLTKGDPRSSRLSPLKPIVSGFDEEGPILDKYSITMLSYRAVRGTNMAKQYKRMIDNEIDYVIFHSGRKIGARQKDSIYNADGSPNTSAYLQNSIINVPFKWWGIQVETQGDKYSQTWGSQLGKLITVNLLSEGKPKDFKGTTEEWKALPEEERLKNPTYALISKERSIREAMIENGYQQLLHTVGISPDGKVSKKKLLSLIKDELTRRELNDNIKDALQLTEEGDFMIPLEALNNYEQIKNIIFSYVDKYISRPKVGGGSKIQTSGIGMEVAGKRIVAHTKGGKTTYTSAGLHFYTKEEPWAGIMVGNWFSKELRKVPELQNATDKEILEYVNNSPDGKEILSGIGFRIPTQELNSVENFKIEGFLPDYLGDMVVVPEGITTKSGGDFDVDKLNTYLKNVYVDAKGVLKLVPYLGKGEEALQAFRELIAKDNLVSLFHLSAKDKLKDYIEPAEDIEISPFSREAYDKYEAQALEDAENDEDLARRMYKQSLENEYYRIAQELLSLPENFDRLITPNHSEELLHMRDILSELVPAEFGQGEFPSVLSPIFMNNLRHMYNEGKGGVGIAASAQVQNAVAQKSTLIIDPSKISKLKEKNEKKYLGNASVLLPSNSIEIGGKKFPTISSVKDRAERFISDKISQFINGFVDIANDPFLVQLGVTRNNAGTFLLLERLGVPTNISVLFMNQPIIREYSKLLERTGMSYPFIEDNIDDIKKQFPVKDTKKVPKDFPTKDLSKLPKLLGGNIDSFYNKSLTQEQNELQHFILQEYLKYAVMAQNLFRLGQATNYDTARFTNPYLFLRKNVQTEDAKQNNIFSSVEEILENTFVGKLKGLIENATLNISSSFFKFLHPAIQPFVFPTMYKLAERKKMNEQEFIKLSRKVEQSFINYLIQNSTGLNSQLHSLLVEETTSAAKLLTEMKAKIESLPNNPFPVISRFITESVSSPQATKTIKMFNKGTDVFSQNTLIAAMAEIKANPATSQLYGKLVRTAFLQSGIGKSPISFLDIVPVEDFKELVLPAIKNLYNVELLRGFQQTDAFFRNSWKDPISVPRLPLKYKEDEFFDYDEFGQFSSKEIKNKFNNTSLSAYAKSKGIPNFVAFKVSEMSSQYSSDFITVQMGEKENKKTYLLKKLIDPSTSQPFTLPYSAKYPNNRYAIYYQINPLGDGYKAQEYYSSLRPSVFTETGAAYIPTELSPSEIIAAIQGNITTEQQSFEEFKEQLPRRDC